MVKLYHRTSEKNAMCIAREGLKGFIENHAIYFAIDPAMYPCYGPWIVEYDADPSEAIHDRSVEVLENIEIVRQKLANFDELNQYESEIVIESECIDPSFLKIYPGEKHNESYNLRL